MQVGEKYYLEISDIIKDSKGKKYAKMKGFNTLMFDEEGINKLKLVKDNTEDLVRAAQERGFNSGRREAWAAARRIAETAACDLVQMGFKVDDDSDWFDSGDEYYASCNIISKYTSGAAMELFDRYDKTRQEKAKEDSNDKLLGRLRAMKDLAIHQNWTNVSLIEMLISEAKKEINNG